MSLDIEAVKNCVAVATANSGMSKVIRVVIDGLINEVLTLRQSLHDLRNSANQSALALAEARMDLERVTGERDAAKVALASLILGYENLLADAGGEDEAKFDAALAHHGMPEDAIEHYKFLGPALDEVHNGDCTNQPQTCSRCLAERTMNRVDAIIGPIPTKMPDPIAESVKLIDSGD